MKKILNYIEEKNKGFETRDIFNWLNDSSIPPRERLGFAPYMAHFVFSFMDVNRFLLRDLANEDELQQLVNIHTNEDSHHWPWYLQDLKLMNFDKMQKFSDTLLFLWGDHGIKSRMITYEMAAIIKRLSPKEKVVLVEVIEKTGNVFLGLTAKVCREGGDAEKSLYYGDNHLACETGHTMGTKDIEDILCAIELTEEEELSSISMIDEVYELYNDFVDEMYTFVTSNDYRKLTSNEAYGSSIDVKMKSTPFSINGVNVVSNLETEPVVV
ncbi:hypothetical protein [Dasania marina]|uniref:hypothetical protein n=1 Tax=Dasania marina TaxID=471499 RepID=UPI00037FEA36|nr:hypothetical protein [Dasania marina]